MFGRRPPTMACTRSHDSRLPEPQRACLISIEHPGLCMAHGWQAREKKIHAHAGGISLTTHPPHHPNPPPTLQSPDSSIPLRAWLTAAHSTLTPLSLSILFPPPPRDARDSRCAGRTRAADAPGGTPDHNVITALSRIVREGTDSSWRCGIDRWGRSSLSMTMCLGIEAFH
jgi:hypothetical protein